jgi:hypothetical protein
MLEKEAPTRRVVVPKIAYRGSAIDDPIEVLISDNATEEVIS